MNISLKKLTVKLKKMVNVKGVSFIALFSGFFSRNSDLALTLTSKLNSDLGVSV